MIFIVKFCIAAFSLSLGAFAFGFSAMMIHAIFGVDFSPVPLGVVMGVSAACFLGAFSTAALLASLLDD